MGPGHLARKAASNAGLHALHVRRRRADIQHGHRVHVTLESVQEPRSDQYWYVCWTFRVPAILKSSNVCSVRAFRACLGSSQVLDNSSSSEDRISPM